MVENNKSIIPDTEPGEGNMSRTHVHKKVKEEIRLARI